MAKHDIWELTKLRTTFVRAGVLSEDDANVLIYGLSHIYESIVKLEQGLNNRLAAFAITDDQELDMLVSLRSEIRHIDYHIHDASLSNLDPEPFEHLLQHAISWNFQSTALTPPEEYQAAREVVDVIQEIYDDVVERLLQTSPDTQVVLALMRQLRYRFWKVDVFIHHNALYRI